jgi:hypothetical protein
VTQFSSGVNLNIGISPDDPSPIEEFFYRQATFRILYACTSAYYFTFFLDATYPYPIDYNITAYLGKEFRNTLNF